MTYWRMSHGASTRPETQWISSIGWQDKRTVEEVAFHEAGHAVMTLMLGRRLKQVAVTSLRTGHSSEERPRTRVHLEAPGERKDPRVIGCLLDTTRILLAGPIADQEYSRARDLFEAGGGYDLDMVAALLGYMEAAFSHAVIQYQCLVDDVSECIMSPRVWHYITILAEALIRTPVMSGDEVVTLLARAGKARNQLSVFQTQPLYTLRKVES